MIWTRDHEPEEREKGPKNDVMTVSFLMSLRCASSFK